MNVVLEECDSQVKCFEERIPALCITPECYRTYILELIEFGLKGKSAICWVIGIMLLNSFCFYLGNAELIVGETRLPFNPVDCNLFNFNYASQQET